MAAVSAMIFEHKKMKTITGYTFSICHEVIVLDDTTLMAESEEEQKEPVDESERGEWKSWLKAQHSENEDHGIWSHHFMGNR